MDGNDLPQAVLNFEARRRQRLKLYIVIIATIPLAIVATHTIWLWGAKAQLNALVATYQAAGEPILVEDYNPSPDEYFTPDAETSTKYQSQAAEAVVLPLGTTAPATGCSSTNAALQTWRRDVVSPCERLSTHRERRSGRRVSCLPFVAENSSARRRMRRSPSTVCTPS